MIYKDSGIIFADTGEIDMITLYNASQANGWGIQKIGDTYISPSPIHIVGNANFSLGYLVDNEELIFSFSDYLTNYALFVETSGDCYIGRYSENPNHNRGAILSGKNIENNLARRFYLKANNVIVANTNIFDWDYGYLYTNYNGENKVYNVSCNRLYFGFYTNIDTIVDGLYLYNTYYGAALHYLSEGNNILVQNCARAILLAGSGDVTLRNIRIKNTSLSDTYVRTSNNAYKNYNFVDSEIDKSKMEFYLSGSYAEFNESIQRLSSTFKFITNSESQIKVYNSAGEIVYSEISAESGEAVTELEYFRKYRNCEAGEIVEEGELDYEPFRVVISKPNFETLEISNIYVTAGQPTVIRAALKPAIEALVTNKGLAIKANKENYGENRDFAIIP